jgi:hypothetical protein
MRYLLVSAAAVMAITGAAAIGNAQMQDDKGKGPAAEGKGPGAGGAQRAPGGGDQAQQPMPDRGQKSEPGKGAERAPGKDQPRAAQKDVDGDKDRAKSATQPQRDKDQRKAAEPRDRDKDQKRAADKQDRDQKRAADQRDRDKDQKRAADKRDRDQDKDRKAADKRDQDKDRKAADKRDRDQDKDRKAAGQRDKDRAGRVQVSEEKRSGVRERLFKENRRVDRVSRTNINVDIRVGTRIPRSVRLHTLPVSIVSFAPAYRGYSYIVLEDDTICIVDPRTFVIVDVIHAGTQRADRPGRTQLTLSAEDRRFIYRTVPKSRTADVRVRLALGAEVPRDVELLAFPEDVVERVPAVRRYRYVVTENDIVIVDPDDHAVALVIEE